MKKAFSKIFVFAMAAMLVVCGMTAAFAANSPVVEPAVVKAEATLADGSKVDVSAKLEISPAADFTEDLTPEQQAVASEAQKTVQNEVAATEVVVGVFDVHTIGTLDLTNATVTITIAVPGAVAGKTYTYAHCKSTSDPKDMKTWETGACVNNGDGTLTITLSGLSPLAIYTAKTGSGSTSAPGTGSTAADHNALIGWCVAGGVAFLGIVAIAAYSMYKKKRA